MIWTKTRLSRWTAGAYRITEDPDHGRPFRLECTDGDGTDVAPQYFAGLDEAKAAASLRSELALFRAENARLRAELAQARGVWPEPSAAADDDGRGIPPAPGRISAEQLGPVACNGHGHGDRGCELCGVPMGTETGDVHDGCRAGWEPEAEAERQPEATDLVEARVENENEFARTLPF